MSETKILQPERFSEEQKMKFRKAEEIKKRKQEKAKPPSCFWIYPWGHIWYHQRDLKVCRVCSKSKIGYGRGAGTV